MMDEQQDDALRFWDEVDRYMMAVTDPDYSAWVDEQCAQAQEDDSADE
jgi:hypothetical protein